jgi:release factor glutamine methyltransferase
MSEQIDIALRWAREQIEGCSESARLDAELLLAHLLDKPRSYLYSHPQDPLEDACWHCYQQLVKKRLEPTPIAYLLGQREFYSMEFVTTPAVLVPRPETELLVEQALALIPQDQPWRICDLGTGTGIIAIILKKERPLARVWATDVDPGCLLLAHENAARHDAAIEFVESDWYRQLPLELEFDLVVSNPPYIAAAHPFLAQGDLPAEPRIALTPGSSGLEALQEIIAATPDYLAPGGHLVLEHGYDQEAAVAGLLKDRGFTEIRCCYDYNDLPRTSVAKLVENTDAGA